MKIAICDDDILDLQSLQSMIWDYDVSLDVTAFRSASALLRAFDTMFFDIIFMDIEMEHPNGYEVAEILMQKKDKPLIIFVTNSGEYTIRGYGIAFRYLPKPLSATAVSDVLKLAIESITPQKIELDITYVICYLSPSILVILIVTSIPAAVLAYMQKDEDYLSRTKWSKTGAMVAESFVELSDARHIAEMNFLKIQPYLKKKWCETATSFLAEKNAITAKHVKYNSVADVLCILS